MYIHLYIIIWNNYIGYSILCIHKEQLFKVRKTVENARLCMPQPRKTHALIQTVLFTPRGPPCPLAHVGLCGPIGTDKVRSHM